MLMAYTLQKLNETKKRIYMYDTYAGMTKPSKKDFRIYDSISAIREWSRKKRKNYNEYAYYPLAMVKKNMSLTRYPNDKIIYVKGKVEETVPKIVPQKISILRLDTDWYESTYHELKYLFPLLSTGGILILDDYGHFAGAKEAVDKYFKEHNLNILLNRIDYTGRLGIKM